MSQQRSEDLDGNDLILLKRLLVAGAVVLVILISVMVVKYRSLPDFHVIMKQD